MKKAFTMIELIFSIVIIGILAAIAMTKISVTRDDAIQSALLANATICINDLVSYYQATQQQYTIISDEACFKAIEYGASIEYIDDVIRVSGISDTLNQDYQYKGNRVRL